MLPTSVTKATSVLLPEVEAAASEVASVVVLAVEQWKSNSRHAPALFGLCFGIASLLIFGADLFLIPALVAIAAALLLARRRLEGSAGASEAKKKEREVTPP